jgi:parvulin-like peptidyl-prolyl isomerase
MTVVRSLTYVLILSALVGSAIAQAPPALSPPVAAEPGTQGKQPATEGAEKPAALVNGEPIAMADVRTLLDLRPSPVPLTEEQKRSMRQTAVALLIDEAVMRQFLRKNVESPSPAAVDKELTELKDALSKKGQTWADYLRQEQQTEEQVRAYLVTDLQWKAYLTKRFSESELKAFYDNNKVYFDDVRVRASHILVRMASNAPAAERQAALNKLQTLRQEIVAGKIDFATAARNHSECPFSKDNGGDIGFFPYRFVVAEPIAQAAFSMKVGEISAPIPTSVGWHLVKVVERTNGEPSKYEDIKPKVRQEYAKELELYPNILAEERKNARIEVLAR